MLGAKGLKDIAEIKTENAVKELKECSFCVACDVKNILCGENGCSAVYGPQKGADQEIVQFLDKALFNYAEITENIYGKEYSGKGLYDALESYARKAFFAKDKLEKEKILYEIAEDIDEDQTYYFEKERIYLYVEKKEKIE